MTFGAAIPAHQNVESLRKLLSSIEEHLPELDSVVVVDDSGDGRVAEQLRDEFPTVEWRVNDRNLGFGPSANRAVSECPADIVILLNDDTVIANSFLEQLHSWFVDLNVFAVTLQAQDRQGNFREGAKRLVWRWGLPKVLHNPADQRCDAAGVALSDYPVGGHSAMRRLQFSELGGFDSLFDPFYWEDVDLGWRAIERGMKIVYDSTCVVVHDGPSAIRQTWQFERIRSIVLRNRILFAIRHGSRFSRFLLPISLAFLRFSAAIKRDSSVLTGIREARKRWKGIKC